MNQWDKYWKMCIPDAGYGHETRTSRATSFIRFKDCPDAQRLLLQEFPGLVDSDTVTHLDDQTIQTALLHLFHPGNCDTNPHRQAQAGLALRCCISHTIFTTCKTLAQRFHSHCDGGQDDLLQDLISLVLNDDGSELIVLGHLLDKAPSNLSDKGAIANHQAPLKQPPLKQAPLKQPQSKQPQSKQIHYILRQDGTLIESKRERCTVSILAQYRHDRGSSLQSWTNLKVRQNNNIKEIFKGFGVVLQTDWSILNQLSRTPTKLEKLSVRSRQIVQAYHKVYRRDRRQKSQQGTCIIPSENQLQEMCFLLLENGNHFDLTTSELLSELQKIAHQVRNINRPKILSLDRDNSSHLKHQSNLSLEQYIFSSNDNTAEKIEEEEMRLSIFKAYTESLNYGIQQGINHQRQVLLRGRRSDMEPFYLQGLRLCYCEGKSTRKIAEELKLPQSKVSRFLKLETLLQQVKHYTTEKFLALIISLSQGLESSHTNPTMLDHLIEEAQSFLDQEIFTPAYKELRAGKNRKFDSLYSQHLRQHLNHGV